ncbi:MAG: hypothetical protein ACM3RP_04060 [Chitinophagales bacterium]
MSESVSVGQLVVSRAGRDQGKAYIVVEASGGGFVKVADGTLRRVAHAKRKNLRHLIVYPAVAREIAEAATGGRIADEQVRQALQRLLGEAEAL